MLRGSVAGERVNGQRGLLTFQGMLASPKPLPHNLAGPVESFGEIAQLSPFPFPFSLPKASAGRACLVLKPGGFICWYIGSKLASTPWWDTNTA